MAKGFSDGTRLSTVYSPKRTGLPDTGRYSKLNRIKTQCALSKRVVLHHFILMQKKI